MRRLAVLLLVCLLAPPLAGLAAPAAHAQGSVLAQHPEVASAIRLLEAWIESQMAYRGLPGLSIGIVYDQELIWARGFGYADVEKKIPASSSTIYRIASITKLFTATALLQLRDQGKLSLDDPVAKHLPWFRIRNPYPGAPAVTIRQLLTHTAGLPREADFPYWTTADFPTRQQIIDTLPNQEMTYPPETRWKYSNLALTLAGEIVVAVSGMPYADYVQRHILEPLGMTSTSVIFPEAHRARLATAYGRRLPDGSRALRPFMDNRGITPAANMSSTVEDLARFASLQFRDGSAGGRQILKGSTLREMHRPHWLQPDWQLGWGLGFNLRRVGDRVLVGHGGALAGYRTQVSFNPREKIAVIVLTNADDGRPTYYLDRAFSVVAPALVRAAAPAPKPAEPDPRWPLYVGIYRSPWGDTEVLIYNNELVMLDASDDNPLTSLSRLVPTGPHTFRLEGEDGYQSLGEPVRFELDADGRVARVKIGANYSDKVK